MTAQVKTVQQYLHSPSTSTEINSWLPSSGLEGPERRGMFAGCCFCLKGFTSNKVAQDVYVFIYTS